MEIMFNQFLKLFVLDIRNTMGLLFWGNFALATMVFMFRFTLFNKGNKTHLLVFGFSKIFQSIAWLTFFLRIDTVIFNPITVLITNTLLFTSYYLESVAMLLLVKDGSKKVYKIQFLLFIIGLLSFYFAVLVGAAANIRVSLASSIIFALIFLPSFQFLTVKQNSLFKKMLGFKFSILLLVLVFRTIYPLFKTSTTLYSADSTQKTVFLIVFLMMIISGVGCLLLLQEEKEMQVKKLLDDKDKFFSIIAHDLRGPFNGIIGLSGLLLENDNQLKPKETNEFVQLIHQSSKNAYSLLDNLLTWAQSQAGSLEFIPEKIEISPIIGKTISLLDNIAKSKNITIRSEIGEKQYIVVDKNMLETIFRNLISNAIKFTNTNGEVVLSMKRENKHIVFSIRDSGIGIAPEKIANLFDINNKNTTSGTNDEKGTGLGLKLCKDFIKKHRGKIWVESEIGKGSNFKFTIPNHL